MSLTDSTANPEVDDITRREFVTMFTAAGLLAACGRDGGEPGSGGDRAQATRSVTHALGTTDIPRRPQRVVTLWRPSLAALLGLGLEPIATAADPRFEEAGLRPHVPPGFDIARLEVLGSVFEPNIERIAFLRPDLILGIGQDTVEDRARYERLSQIAPTVLLTWGGTTTWKQHFADIAAALGLEDKAREVVGQYETRVSEVADALDRPPRDIQVSIAVFQAADLIRLQARNSFAGQVVADVGLGRPPSQDVIVEGSGHVEISLERLADIDGDVLFAMIASGAQEEASAFLESTKANPLWANLGAVRQDAVHVVDFNLWQAGNYFAANRILDELERVLTGAA